MVGPGHHRDRGASRPQPDVDCLRRARAADARWLDLRPEVQRRFNDEVQRKLGSRVWARVERSWYKNAAGRITNNWSSTTFEYWLRTRRADLADYTLAARRTDERPVSDAGAAVSARKAA